MHQHRHDGAEYRRIELITGTSRRRRWSEAEKAALVAESLRPGVNVSDLARRSGVNRSLLQTWRRMSMRGATDRGEVFVPLSRMQDGGVEEVERLRQAAGSDRRADGDDRAGEGRPAYSLLRPG